MWLLELETRTTFPVMDLITTDKCGASEMAATSFLYW